ncbi:hypothetical protein P3L10_017274 [Capsicum annuum]
MEGNLVYDPQIFGHYDNIFCSSCDTRIARVDDYVPNADDLVFGGYFNEFWRHPTNQAQDLLYALSCAAWVENSSHRPRTSLCTRTV